MKIAISTFYHFVSMTKKQTDELQKKLLEAGKQHQVRGLFILATEGCNATFSGAPKDIVTYKEFLNSYFDYQLRFKDSSCDFHPFHQLKIKQRSEIVSLHRADLRLIKGKLSNNSDTQAQRVGEADTQAQGVGEADTQAQGVGEADTQAQGVGEADTQAQGVGEADTQAQAKSNTNLPQSHLSPSEWNKKLLEGKAVVLDARNNYEFEMGRFKNAINPQVKEFNEFPEYLKKSGIDKNKEVLIYCTGGIRCEKAALEMKEQGFNQVYQLEGGILNYLDQSPNAQWKGDCFVFDYRIALDQQLSPTKTWKLCPHCGDPGKQKISCLHCGDPEIVCFTCTEKQEHFKTCSKNCAHHYKMGHKFKSKNKKLHNIHKPQRRLYE